MGQELFGILDANHDEILNQKDIERFVENSEKISVQIDNKVQGKNEMIIKKIKYLIRFLRFS